MKRCMSLRVPFLLWYVSFCMKKKIIKSDRPLVALMIHQIQMFSFMAFNVYTIDTKRIEANDDFMHCNEHTVSYEQPAVSNIKIMKNR